MTRIVALRSALGAASATAIAVALAACSQPASHATVDLSGSYRDYQPQAYSTATGLPVYKSSSAYGAQPAYPSSAAPVYEDTGLVYAAPPTNQVASLDYNVGIPTYEAAPVYQTQPVYDGPASLVADYDTELGGDYVHVGDYGGTQTAMLNPQPINDAVLYDAQPPMQSVEVAPPASQDYVSIETQPLQELAPLPEEEVTESLPYYVDAPSEAYGEPVPVYSEPEIAYEEPTPVYQPPAPQADYTEHTGGYLDLDPEPTPTAAPLPQIYDPAPPASDMTAPAPSTEYPRPYESLRPGVFPSVEPGDGYVSTEPMQSEYIAQAAPPVYDPAPYVFEAEIEQASYQTADIGEVVHVSNAPIYDEPVEGSIYSAPPVYEGPAMAEAMAYDPAPMDRATARSGPVLHYEIQRGDTLYSIARNHAVTPQELASANGLSMSGTIFPGQKLIVPSQIYQQSAPMAAAPVYVAPVAMEPANVTGTILLDGEAVPMVDVGAAQDLAPAATPQPAERAQLVGPRFATVQDPAPKPTPKPATYSTTLGAPVETAAPRFMWPVHGDVFQLGAGQIEIAAPGGSAVSAAAAGRIAIVESGPMGVLVVVEHADGWRSLVVGLESATAAVGDAVQAGEQIGIASRTHRVRFELRDAQSARQDVVGALRG